MSSSKTVVVRMEESYMRATIEYSNVGYQPEICDTITHLESKLGLSPEVIYQKDSPNKGFCSVEFSGDDYVSSRSCGEFIEELISILDIKKYVRD